MSTAAEPSTRTILARANRDRLDVAAPAIDDAEAIADIVADALAVAGLAIVPLEEVRTLRNDLRDRVDREAAQVEAGLVAIRVLVDAAGKLYGLDETAALEHVDGLDPAAGRTIRHALRAGRL